MQASDDFLQLTLDNFDELKAYEGPDKVHILSRLAIAQQLRRLADRPAPVVVHVRLDGPGAVTVRNRADSGGAEK